MLTLPNARYQCTGCGDCCRGWNIPLYDDEAERFRGWASGLIPEERLRGAIGRVKHGNREIEKLGGPGTACVALAADDRCVLHSARGPDEKPRVCRIFPMTFARTPDGVRVGLSYACPAVLDGDGPPLAEQRAEIEALFASVVDGTRFLIPIGAEVRLDGEHTLPWPEAARLLEHVALALEEPGPSGAGALASEALAARVGRAGALVALTLLELGKGASAADAVSAAIAGRDELAREALAEPPEVDQLSRAMLRTLLTATEPGRGALQRLGGAIASVLGGGEVRLAGGDGKELGRVPQRAIDRVARALPPEGEALIARWLADGVRALSFFGEVAFDLPIASGLDLKVLSAAVAVRLSRAWAAHHGRTQVTLEDLKGAVRQLEAGLTHRSAMPTGFAGAVAATASLDLLREELGAAGK